MFTLRSKLCVPNLLGYITKKTYFSWSTHCKNGILQGPRKTSWWDEKKEREGCLTKLKNKREAALGIFRNTYWSPKQFAEIYNAFFKDFFSGVGIATDKIRDEMERERNEGMMQIAYEEKGLLRFAIYRWVLPAECGKSLSTEEFENWQSTLRSALGVKTVSQSAPDMIISDHFSSGVNTVMSKEFLEHRKFNDFHVFRIHTPGTRCSTVGAESYFFTGGRHTLVQYVFYGYGLISSFLF